MVIRPPNLPAGGLPHVGPFPYVHRIPMLMYGPGHVRAVGEVDRPVDLADVAPTLAALLRFPYRGPDGRPMDEAVEADGAPPRLLVTVVLDAGGRNVLQRWPDAWPTIAGMIEGGAWYTRASIGAAPDTPATLSSHATIGTGAHPRTHGLLAKDMRIDGEVRTTEGFDHRLLLTPTLADLYDAATGNRALVGTVATLGIQLGMMGVGARTPHGDRDLLVLREDPGGETLGAEGTTWALGPPYDEAYAFPAYANDLPALDTYFDAVDRIDGTADGRWRGHAFDEAELIEGFATPARLPYQTRLIEEVVRREGFGADAVTDLLFVNYKAIDDTSHLFGFESLEMRDTIRVQDEAIGRLVASLDRLVGRGEWAMILTADHGAAPDPASRGGIEVSLDRLVAAIDGRFDDGDAEPLLELWSRGELFVDRAELRDVGATLRDVSAFVMDLTNADVAAPRVPPAPGTEAEPAYLASFPSSMLRGTDRC